MVTITISVLIFIFTWSSQTWEKLKSFLRQIFGGSKFPQNNVILDHLYHFQHPIPTYPPSHPCRETWVNSRFIGWYFHKHVKLLQLTTRQWAKNAVIWTKNLLNPDKFPQTVSGRLELFLCLGQAMQTSDFVAYYFPLNAVANYWWKYLLLPLGLLYCWFVFFQPYTIPISAIA